MRIRSELLRTRFCASIIRQHPLNRINLVDHFSSLLYTKRAFRRVLWSVSFPLLQRGLKVSVLGGAKK